MSGYIMSGSMVGIYRNIYGSIWKYMENHRQTHGDIRKHLQNDRLQNDRHNILRHNIGSSEHRATIYWPVGQRGTPNSSARVIVWLDGQFPVYIYIYIYGPLIYMCNN